MTVADIRTPRVENPHYSAFYTGDPSRVDRPVAIVIGNCQAESLRLFLGGPDLGTVRIPAVHELLEEDMPALGRWLGRADVVVTQPIRDRYHGLPVGSAEVARTVGAASRIVLVPVVRFAGLYPTHAIVRPPSDPSLVPPVVEYHDLEVLVEAAARRDGSTPPRLDLTPDRVRAIAEESLGQLRYRESRADTVIVSDLFAAPAFELMRTLNHPGNPIWAAMAVRVRERLGLAPVADDPRRPVLDSVHAPRLPVVAETFGFEVPAGEPEWVLGGVRIPVEQIRAEHLRWYEQHPEVIDAGLTRHAEALRILGL